MPVIFYTDFLFWNATPRMSQLASGQAGWSILRVVVQEKRNFPPISNHGQLKGSPEHHLLRREALLEYNSSSCAGYGMLGTVIQKRNFLHL